MSVASALKTTVKAIRLNDYAALVILVATGYDYILTFSKEIEYIWNQRWTRMSILFVFVRYFGLCYVMMNAICDILFKLVAWAGWILFISTDLVTTLRVWVVYNQSRLILVTLIILVTIKAIIFLVRCIMISAQSKSLVATIQVLDVSFCAQQSNGSPVFFDIVAASQIALSTLMCSLVTLEFIKQSFQMYHVTKQFQLSRYMNILAKEGMIYFSSILTYTIINIIINTATIPEDQWYIILVASIQSIPMFTLAPRFILNLRELYARDLRGRCGGEIDTAFGLTSQFTHQVIPDTIRFAEAELNERVEDYEGIPMSENTGGSHA